MKRLLYSLLIINYSLFIGAAHATLKVDIIAGNAEPIPIAIARFDAAAANRRAADEIRTVVENNLRSSGLFHIIDVAAHPETLQFDRMPRFESWRAVNTNALVQSRLTRTADGQFRLQFYVWDINGKEQIEAKSLVTAMDAARRLGHIMSDTIYTRLTGEGGYFDTQIVFTAETGSVTNPTRRLAVMDSDGHNFRYISDNRTQVMGPHFSPNMQQLVFLSYRNDDMNVWTLDMNDGTQRRLGQFGGLNFAPRWSPDGQRVAFSLVDARGASNIFEYNIETKEMRRLTNTNGINTSPAYSPCGRLLAYNSNASGSQQLHVLDLQTLRSRRISFGDGRYATPAFSPDGNFLAFTRIANNTFYIGVMSPEGRNERTLASGWHVEAPSWAPNSRRLIYYETERTEGGKERVSHIRTVDILGHFNQKIPLPRGVSGTDPTWSPLLP